MKKFWKKTEGFTLVELIVVIAILGILAGVGTVGYSGYIAKANKAADEILLDSLNTAFAAACIENNDDINSPDVTPTATLDADGKVASITYQDAFEDYYDMSAKFKVITALKFENGMFVDAAVNAVNNKFAQIFAGLNIADSVSAVKVSTFGGIGAAGLMDKVGDVTDLAAGLAGANATFKNALAQNMQTLAATMGYTTENDPDGSKFKATYQKLLAETAAKIDPENPTSDAAVNAAGNQILANYAVLAAAQNTTKTSDELLAELHVGIKVDDIKNLMKGNGESSQEGLSKAAMMYAMYTAYANQMPDTTDEEKAAKEAALQNASTTEGFLAHMEDAEFKAYLNDADGSAKTDLEGYLGALDIIKQSAQGNADAVSDLLINGYTDPALVSALQGLIG